MNGDVYLVNVGDKPTNLIWTDSKGQAESKGYRFAAPEVGEKGDNYIQCPNIKPVKLKEKKDYDVVKKDNNLLTIKLSKNKKQYELSWNFAKPL